MIHHTRAVARGANRALVVVDMPFLTYQVSPEQATRNATRLFQEGGAGSHCDGQVLVSYDVLGLFDTFAPPFAKQYAQLGQVIVRAAKDYANDVREGLFPKSTRSNQQTSDVAGRRLIPSLNDRTFEELKGPRVPVS